MKHLQIRILTCALALLFHGISTPASANPLFQSDDTLEITIEAPLTTLVKKRSDVDYLDGTIGYTDAAGVDKSFDLKLRTRGRFRLKKSTCVFPPIRLNFRKGQVKDSLFENQDKLKLVTHCKSTRPQSEQLVLREYLAYRILETLTDKSLATRLLKITYIDSESDKEPLIKYGFVIEDDDHVAERVALTSLKSIGLNYRDLDAKQANLVSVFQYLIGNTDYSIIRGPDGDDCCHNSIPLSNGEKVFPVPYDFDFSGIVDARYASPNPRFKIRKVTQRLYRGRCSHNSILPDTLAYMQTKKVEIYGLVDQIVDLDKKNRQKVTRYLDSFYEDISDDEEIEKKLIKKCS